MKNDLDGNILHAPEERCRKMTETILRFVDPAKKSRVLDLGCGAGDQLLDLAPHLPDAELAGVDFSEPNIRAATARARNDPAGREITFILSDYMDFREKPFDLIFADSSLPWMPLSRELLFKKISNDLVDGGRLVATIPYACLFNYALELAVILCRLFRSRLLEEFIFKIGKIAHGKQYSDDFIRERVIYMFLRTNHYDSGSLRRFLSESCRLDLEFAAPVPHASIAQPKHRLLIFKKRAGR